MRHLSAAVFFLCLCLTLLTPSANALEFTIEAPNAPEYGIPTSVEPVYTADSGERANEDLSKDAAILPPRFGSPVTVAATPYPVVAENLAVGYPTVAYTDVTEDLYYSAGYLAILSIPRLGVNVEVYEGTDADQLANGVGHFPGTSIWSGNVAIAGHNRGINFYFGDIHKLAQGDMITLTTRLGTRTYAVTSVSKVHESDTSMLTATAENCITLYTCVRNESAYRWCVRALEIV